MNEHLSLKRGLLRLRVVTIAELAAHCGVKWATTKSFLVEQEPLVRQVGSVSLGTRGRPRKTWALQPEGERQYRAEIARVLSSLEERGAERVQALKAVRESMETLSLSLVDLESLSRSADEFEAACRPIERRLDATRSALAGWNSEASLFVEETALEKLADRLAACKRRTQLEPVMNAASHSLRAYVGDWLAKVRKDIEQHVRIDDWYVPAAVVAAPLLLIDDLAQDVPPAFKAELIDTARKLGAPVIRVAINGLSGRERQHVLDRLETQMGMAAGAATQLVFTLDGSRSDARSVADEFVKLNRARTDLRITASPEMENPLARAVISAVGSAWTRVGLTEPGDVGVQVFPRGAYVIGGALNRQAAIYKYRATPMGYLDPFAAPGTSFARPICMDHTQKPQLGKLFSAADIGYFRFGDKKPFETVFSGSIPLSNTANPVSAAYSAASPVRSAAGIQEGFIPRSL